MGHGSILMGSRSVRKMSCFTASVPMKLRGRKVSSITSGLTLNMCSKTLGGTRITTVAIWMAKAESGSLFSPRVRKGL